MTAFFAVPPRPSKLSIGKTKDTQGNPLPCTMEGCEAPIVARGLCNKHNVRRWRAKQLMKRFPLDLGEDE